MRRITGAFLSVVMVGSGMGALMGAGTANAWPSRVFVSPTGSSRGADVSCRTAGFSSINRAISKVATTARSLCAAAPTTRRRVIRKPLSADRRAGRDHQREGPEGGYAQAAGRQRNRGPAGPSTSQSAASGSTGPDSTRSWWLSAACRASPRNVLKHNGDVGVDFNGTSLSIASHNVSKFNKGGGFLVADDVGPTQRRHRELECGQPQPGRLRGYHRRAQQVRRPGQLDGAQLADRQRHAAEVAPAPGSSSRPRSPARRSPATP